MARVAARVRLDSRSSMDLRQLRYFLAVAEELHFGRAAERVFIAQSPLSRQIRQLEQELGVQLFRRTKRSVELTDAGRAFVPEVEAIFAGIVSARHAALGAHHGRVGRLTIGFTDSAMYTAFPHILRAFTRAYPQVKLTLKDHVLTPDQVTALLGRRMDIGLLRPPIGHHDIELLPIARERIMMALPSDHPLSRRQGLRLVDLAHQPFITFARTIDSSLSTAILSLCHERGFQPNVVQEVQDVPTMVMLAASGVGVALVPSSARLMLPDGAVLRDLDGDVAQLTISLAWNRGVHSAVRDAFVRVASEVVAEISAVATAPEHSTNAG